MKRLVSSKGGEVSYGPKWKHTESSSDSENNDDDLHSPTITAAHVDNQDQIPKGKRVEVTVKDGELMYEAALQGDWVAAEVLLDRDPKLAHDYITEEGDRALHVAAAMKHEEFVKKLVARMREEELALLDGHGYTACCYAAISGNVKIARLIIENRPNLVTARDEENATPLRKAALRGKKKMLSFLLKYSKDEDLSREEWFDLLLVAIRGKMFGVAIDIMGKSGSIATVANEEGTALHLLARIDASSVVAANILVEYGPYAPVGAVMDYRKGIKFRRLGEKLWSEMLQMEKANLVELIKRPVHIIHEAAKAGQVEMITMLTRSFPKLVWETDSNGYTMFHLAVMYRRAAVFNLVHQVEAMLCLRTTWQDQQGNNILHLAAAKPSGVAQPKLSPAYQMQRELKFFEAVKRIVPLSCLVTRNGEGVTHRKLLKESATWMTNRADSLMLIATILLTVVFAAAFTVPGGYNSQTGEPVLAKKNWFKVFVVFEVLSIMFSVQSIIMFQTIMASSFAQREFLDRLPSLQRVGFESLLMSLAGALMAFMASILLFNINMNGLVWFGFAFLCLYGSPWAIRELGFMRCERRISLFNKKKTLNLAKYALRRLIARRAKIDVPLNC